MLQEFQSFLSLAAHLAAVLLLLYGAFRFIAGMLGLGGAQNYVHAAVAIVIGTWLAGIVG